MAKYKVVLIVLLAAVLACLVVHAAFSWASRENHNAYQECLETWSDVPSDVAESHCFSLT